MRILIAEDERQMQYAIGQVLKMSGYECDSAYNGMEALEKVSQNAYDCMICDIMMPVMDGIEAVKQIREKGHTFPVIMLTAKTQVDDRVDGLDAGADDYLTKPFSMKELLARIRSLIRRNDTYTQTRISLGNVVLDKDTQELRAENSIRLAKKEAQLLEYFLLNREKNLSTDDIFSHIWKDEEMEKDVVYVYVSYLRGKLSSVAADIEITGERDGDFRLCLKSSDGSL